MGKTIIDNSDKKNQIVKKILAGMGFDANPQKKLSPEEYRQQLLKVSVWSDEDIKALENAGGSIKFRAAEW